MSADYEAEQRELKDRAAALQGELDKAQEATVNAEKFMSVVRKYLSTVEHRQSQRRCSMTDSFLWLNSTN